MSKNQFNSRIPGNEYSRVMRLALDYVAPMTAKIDVVLQPHVHINGDIHKPTGSSKTLNFSINPIDFAPTNPELGTVERVIQLRDVSTGELLGVTMTMGQLFTGVASLIREQELAAEAAANPPAEA